MKDIDLYEIIKSEEKGLMVELLSNRSINSVIYLTCAEGYVYGNHYHKYTTHYNYVAKGKILLVTQMRNNEIIKSTLLKGELYTILPMEKHAVFTLEDSEILVLANGPNNREEFEADTYSTLVTLL